MKYKIWDKKERIYTPLGHSFSAEEWLDRYAWAKNEGVKVFNKRWAYHGAFMGEFSSFVSSTKDGLPY